jgi:predicted O-linked N-acetylglucosamine transferase (SPINDLY family)
MSTKTASKKKDQPANSEQGHWDQIELNAKTGKLTLDEIINHADTLQKKGDTQRIDVLYSNWIKSTNSPHKFVACFNYGVLLANWGRDDDAIAIYEQAIQLLPTFAHPRVNMGLAYERKGNNEKAVACWKEIIENPMVKAAAAIEMQTTALNHIGRLREQERNYSVAEEALTQSLEINPNQGDALHHWFHLRQKQCKWPVLENLPPRVSKNTVIRSMSPLAALAFSDDPAFQMFVGDKIVREKFTYPVEPLIPKNHRYNHTRIRVGYLSGDLCTHAVGLILPELFELHDRNHFEIFAYDYGKEDGTALRARYKQAIEHFTPIQGATDHQAASKIRADEIDILVDLHGLSLGLRAAIMGMRPAPIQATYLGYIGTTMMPYIDYAITDKYSFTPEMQTYFSEAPILLDRSCLPTDRKRAIDPTPTRAEIGLPDDKFIFATFNNSYKLNDTMFTCWMNILKRVPNSILWIIDDNEWATKNLKAFAVSQEVQEDRLLFTPRVLTSQYLARMPLADMFLDNHPYNAGSTATDILWMGTPMVTLAGATFVSRMAGSMLHFSGLDELITHSHAEYEERVVALSGQPAKLAEIRQRLLAQREPNGAFDMNLFTQNLEQKYREILSQSQN